MYILGFNLGYFTASTIRSQVRRIKAMLGDLLQKIYEKFEGFLGVSSNSKVEQNRQKFLDSYLPQSELEFLDICFMEVNPTKRRIALAIRRAIASLGSVDECAIHAENSFDSLGLLPFWSCCGDAGFDTSLFVEEIERNLEVKFSDKELELANVRDPDLNPSMKIFEFVREFYDWCSSR
jgi:hypothetical protein